MVVINSSSENDFLVANFRNEITIDDWTGGARGGAWIGLIKILRDQIEWVDGNYSYANYGRGG